MTRVRWRPGAPRSSWRPGRRGRPSRFARNARSANPLLLIAALGVGVVTGSLVTGHLRGSAERPAASAGRIVAPSPDGQLAGRTPPPPPALPEVPVSAPTPPLEVPPLIITPEMLPEAAIGEPAWRRYALATPVAEGQPMIAVVIDDVGIDRARSTRAIALPGPLTMSFLAYAADLPEQAGAASTAGHELMVHVPMGPHNPDADPGPNALLLELDDAELQQRLHEALGRFDGFVGINNHMGSRFTESHSGMAAVMPELKSLGLLFLDSRTSGESVAFEVAQDFAVPAVRRDVFLDHDPAPEAIRAALSELEELAERRGFAVGIGHPRDATIEVLTEWIPDARARGFALVPISAVVQARAGSG